MKKWIKRISVAVVLLGLIGAAAGWYFQREDGQPLSYRASEIKRGDLVVSISATGTVEPEEVIDVGAQVAGQILSFGKDANNKTVDYGSLVEEGTILARIDDSLYTAEAAQITAQVQQNKASVQRVQADLEQLKAKLYQAQRDWERAKKLGPSEALAETTYDAYQSAYEIAKANVAVGEAAILQAQSAVSQSEALLQRAQRNLGLCTIKSPVKGVIIDRRVNIGQTVVASLNAPSLFLIAKDIRRMQVWVAVNEADIGRIQPGQKVSFTVDAFPGRTFQGQVGKVRLNASMSQNVVTYTVEVIADNSDGVLLPYLTAGVQFEMDYRRNVLLAPNAALRWTPPGKAAAPEATPSTPPATPRPEGRRGGSQTKPRSTSKPALQPQRGTVWVLQDDQLLPITVRVGASDGIMTEIEGDGLKEGMDVVVGHQVKTDANSGEVNPFAPKRSSRGFHMH